jgi:hypothetical protein
MKAALFAVALLAACDEGGSSPAPVEVFDQGRACLLGHEPAGTQRTTFVADQPVSIDVGSFACISGSCTKDRIASCEATVTGSSIEISTRASWRFTGDTACTDDCASPSASCTTPPLPAGTYTVSLGTHTTTLEIPSMPAMFPCLGEEF